jgi:hypothetical protein
MSAARGSSAGGKPKRSNKNRRRKGGGKGAAVDAKDFWGETSRLPSVEQVRITSEPAAVVRSLGRPPLSSQGRIAEIYFQGIYDRAVTLATALAAAGDLVEPEDLAAG